VLRIDRGIDDHAALVAELDLDASRRAVGE